MKPKLKPDEVWLQKGLGALYEPCSLREMAGLVCPKCEEGYDPGDHLIYIPYLVEDKTVIDTSRAYWHIECFIRDTAGSVGHQARLCSCYGGTAGDPPGLSRHAAARVAYAFFLANQNPPDEEKEVCDRVEK